MCGISICKLQQHGRILVVSLTLSFIPGPSHDIVMHIHSVLVKPILLVRYRNKTVWFVFAPTNPVWKASLVVAFIRGLVKGFCGLRGLSRISLLFQNTFHRDFADVAICLEPRAFSLPYCGATMKHWYFILVHSLSATKMFILSVSERYALLFELDSTVGGCCCSLTGLSSGWYLLFWSWVWNCGISTVDYLAYLRSRKTDTMNWPMQGYQKWDGDHIKQAPTIGNLSSDDES